MNTSSGKLWDLGSIPMIEPEFLGNILATASDLAMVINSEDLISSVLINEAEQNFGDLSHWQGHPIWKFLTVESSPKLKQALDLVRAGSTVMHSIEINHQDNAKWQFPVRYSIHRLGRDNDVLLLGRNLRSLSEIQKQLVDAQTAIERSHEQRREFDAHYRMLLASSSEAVLFVAVSDGTIQDHNRAASLMLGEEPEAIEGTHLREFCDPKKHGKIVEDLCVAASTKTPLEVMMLIKGKYHKTSIKPILYRVSGQRVLLCRIFEDKSQEPKDGYLISSLMSLYKSGTDAIVFTNANGVIQYANERFLDLINVANFSDILGSSLADYLARGQIDLAVMLENVMRSGQMRYYSTKLTNDFGVKVGVEVSISHLNPDQNGYISFVIRSVAGSQSIAAESDNAIAASSQDNVAQLVGSATLKEIVSETTDVIEKICIETAIDLTNNNRAAAAEMLGLSRQSLYVKLRKLGLISSAEE